MENTYESVFEKARQIMNAHDPVDLNGAPWDEYDPEIEAILNRYANAGDVDELTEIVWEVFVLLFNDRIAGPKEKYRPLAQDLWNLRSIVV